MLDIPICFSGMPRVFALFIDPWLIDPPLIEPWPSLTPSLAAIVVISLISALWVRMMLAASVLISMRSPRRRAISAIWTADS